MRDGFVGNTRSVASETMCMNTACSGLFVSCKLTFLKIPIRITFFIKNVIYLIKISRHEKTKMLFTENKKSHPCKIKEKSPNYFSFFPNKFKGLFKTHEFNS